MEQMTFSVSELNEYVSGVLASDPFLKSLRVEGEISGFKRHTSGHLYFSLKDDRALVRCVMFKGQAMRLGFRPADGMQVTLLGYASLYARDGSFQLYAQSMEQSGEGALLKKFLRLKAELAEEGLFDPAHKRPIPFLPRCVGVVTSGTGAALQDILQILRRRFPPMHILVCPVQVQGEGAAAEIAAGIQRMNAAKSCDVLIVGRGGGSVEDLWAFNEPVVARAIYGSAIPVISAVGHETDFSIADFVADLRAPTPSAAAELAVPELSACQARMQELSTRLSRALRTDLLRRRDAVRLTLLSGAFSAVRQRIADGRQATDLLTERLIRAASDRCKADRAHLAALSGRLSAVNPASVLLRGYAMVTTEAGGVRSSVRELHENERVRLVLGDGTAGAVITDLPED